LSNVSRRLGDAAVDRYLYGEWLSAATVLNDFPAKAEHLTLAATAHEHYQQLSSQFPCEAACSVVTVCDVLVEACVRAATSVSPDEMQQLLLASNGSASTTTTTSTATEAETTLPPSMLNVWSQLDQEAAARINAAAAKREQLLRVVYHGDQAQARLEMFDLCECCVGGRTLLSIVRHMQEDCARVPGGRGRAGMPREPAKSESERGAELNELLTFLNTAEEEKNTEGKDDEGIFGSDDDDGGGSVAAVTPNQLAHTRVVNLFQGMLHRDDPAGAKIWKDNGAFHQRKYRERLGPTTLSQVMTRAMLDSDKTLTTYDADTDQILVACHTKTWDQRRNTTRFMTSDTTTGYCSVPPGFARWRIARERRLRAKVSKKPYISIIFVFPCIPLSVFLPFLPPFLLTDFLLCVFFLSI
jgi:hypothetical protein